MTSLAPPAMAGSPFEHGHADPWARHFIDLPELNAKVTDAIQTAISTVRTAARKKEAELRTSSLLVLGPAGAGKTHLFARLRQKLGPKAIFVHLRPLVGTEMTPRYVLGQIVHQLGYEALTSSEDTLKQLEALVGSSLAHLENESPEFPRIFIDDVGALDEVRRAERLEDALERLLEKHQEADETYLARLLQTPFMKPALQRAALAWLSGWELEESQMKRLGVSASLAEERVMQALQTLGLFASIGAPIVLVFDQLENLMDPEGTGARVRAYANLVAELFDSTRGYVLVQMALDSEWEQAILPQLTEAQKTRLGNNMAMISLPTPTQSKELVRRWVDHLSDRPEPFPWPFAEKRLEHWADTPGMTPRMLMIACRQALALGPNAPFEEERKTTPISERSTENVDEGTDEIALGGSWQKHLEGARRALDEAAADRRSADVARLAGGIACSLRFAAGIKMGRVDARQPVQILAQIKGEPCAISISHQTHHTSATAAIHKAADYLSKGRVIVLRERPLDFPPTWKKVTATQAEIIKKGARWVTLERDDAANLLALESFLAAATSHDLEDANGRAFHDDEVKEWVVRTLRVEDWPLLSILRGENAGDELPAEQPSTRVVTAQSSRDIGAVSDTAGTIHACLTQLRVASLERLVREVVRIRPLATRAEIITTLEGMSGAVRWYGRSIVAMGTPGGSA